MRKTPPCIAAGECFVFSGRSYGMRKALYSCAFLLSFLLFPSMLNAQAGLTFIAPDTVLVGDSAMFIVQGKSSGDAFLWQWEENCYSCDTLQCYEYSDADTLWRVWADTGHHLVTVMHNGIQFQKWVFVMKYDPDCISNISTCGNLVANGSFEDYAALPTCSKQLQLACSWRQALARNTSTNGVFHQNPSADYWHAWHAPSSPYPKTDCGVDMSPPTGDWASQAVSPVGDMAYAGFFASVTYPTRPFGDPNGSREYIQQRLQTPLIPGHTYQLQISTSLGEISILGTNIQVAFTYDLPRGTVYPARLNIPTLAEGDYVDIPLNSNKTAWTTQTINFTYDGQQPAYYMTIGNFNTWANTTKWYTGVPQDIYDEYYGNLYYVPEWVYYLVDNISLVDLTPQCCTAELVQIKNNVGQTYSSASQYTTAAGTDYYLQGRLYVDVNTTYSNSTFWMAPDARIEIAGGKKLTFQNCTLRACTIMWDFIDVFGPGTEIEMIDCVVMDAEIAIDARANATVNVTGTQFINNHKGIYIHGYTATAPLTINRNTFTSNGGMLHPRKGQRSYMHIQLKDVPHANMAPSTYVQKNVYSYATYGIHAMDSELRLGHSDFNMIRNYHNQAGGAWAVYSYNAPNKGMRHLDMADPGSGPNYFVNCDNGVYAAANLRVDIQNNELLWIKDVGIKISHIHNQTGVPIYARVRNNELMTYGDGIQVFNMTSDCLLEGNEITSNDKNLNNSGIYIYNGPRTTSRCNTIRKFLIKGNNIDAYGSGIRTLNAPCLVEFENEIDMGNNALGEFRGIFNFNSFNTLVLKNEMNGYDTDWRWSGIRQDNSVKNQVYCNYVDHTGHALYMSGYSMPQYVELNEMHTARNGVLLNYGIIGAQSGGGTAKISTYNRWTGTITNHFHADNSYGPQSPFYFDNTYLGQPEFPSPIVSVATSMGDEVPYFGTGILATSTGVAPTYICTWDYGMTSTGVLTTTSWGSAVVQPMTDKELVEQLIEEPGEFSEYYLQAYRHNEQTAYDLLQNDPSLYEDDTDLEDYLDNGTHGVRNAYYEARKALDELRFDDVRDFANPTAFDDVWTGRLRQLMGFAIPLYKGFDTIPGCEPLPLEQLDSLLYFASLCPYEYFDIPGVARGLLGIMGIPYSTHDCETVTDPPAPKIQAAQDKGQFLVYPNPATETVNLKLPDTMEKSSTLVTVLDATGKLVYSSGYTTTLDVSGWKSGLYICRVSDGKENHRSTFIVQ